MLSRSEDLDWKANRCLQNLDSEENRLYAKGCPQDPNRKQIIWAKANAKRKLSARFWRPKTCARCCPTLETQGMKKTVVPFLANKEMHGKMRVFFSGVRLAQTAIRNDLLFFLCAQKCWQIQSELCKPECCPKS